MSNRYYYDTEFLEGIQDKTFMGIKYGKTPPTIDLISIGIVSDDNREYYAISKDFNLKEAWNRYDIKIEQMYGDMRNTYPEGRKTKVYWIRENVLRPIFKELNKLQDEKFLTGMRDRYFTYSNMKYLINKYGKSNKQIAKEIKDFISMETLLNKKIVDHYGFTSDALRTFEGRMACIKHNWGSLQFYGYYSAYDHVVLCWLFGKMIDLPDEFPYYTIDLKQELDNILTKEYDGVILRHGKSANNIVEIRNLPNLEARLEWIKNYAKYPHYPKQTNEHSSIHDARWNKELYNFLQTI